MEPTDPPTEPTPSSEPLYPPQPAAKPTQPLSPEQLHYAPPPLPSSPSTFPQQVQAHAQTFLPQSTARWNALSQTRKIVVAAIASIVALCVVCSCCGVGLAALNGGGKTTITGQSTSTTKPATATPKPTNTPDLLAEYRAMASADLAKLSKALTDMSTPCQNADVAGCRSGAKEVNDTVHAFQADLDAHPAPACLKTTDTHLRAALALFEHGSQNAMDGIDNLDTDLISQGTSDITAGGKEIDKATAALKSATC
jgi:hypothetical protein